MTAPDPWHERWMRLREFVEGDSIYCLVIDGLCDLTKKDILSEMARLEKEK